MSIDPAKAAAVAEWPHHTTVSELRSLLGFASYYRQFVEGFSKLAAPLHRLVAELSGTKTRKAQGPRLNGVWTDNCKASFQALKQKLPPPWCLLTLTYPFLRLMPATLVRERFGPLLILALALQNETTAP